MTDLPTPLDRQPLDPELLATLARLDSDPPDPSVRGAVLAAAAGAPRPVEPPLPALEVFAGCVADLATLLEQLAVDELDAQVEAYGWTVAELLAHLAAVEVHMRAVLGIDPAAAEAPVDPDRLDHLGVGAVFRRALLAGDRATIATVWRDVADDTVRRLSAGEGPSSEQMVQFHQWPFTIETLLIARSFEVWTHADDIRRATSRPLVAPPPRALRTMSTASVASLPLLVPVVAGRPRLEGVRVVLTGLGGGTHDIGGPDRLLTLVVDVVDYCRLVARRADASALEVHGDAGLAADLVAAAQAIAM